MAPYPPTTHHLMQEQLGRYRILSKLGEGGMGVVYAAEDPGLGRSVALKTLRAGLATDDMRERLRREARAAASISHPNVCQLFEIGEDGGELFIAMELLEGEPLSARIARGPLPVKEAVHVALSVLDALAALHKRGVLHRDLKPSNIFLTPHGAKILDFGIARLATEDEQRTMLSLTGEGVVLGTPRYMAPEHASGGVLDHRSDLFAVGAILYEMLAGRPAFDGPTPVRTLHAIMYEQPPALTGSPVIAAIDRVVHRALAKHPANRYASAEDFAADLRVAADDTSSTSIGAARPLSRLIVLPFRMFRPDPEIDYLSFSLADAITTSLGCIGSLVVRSTIAAAKFNHEQLDLQHIAREADVDAVLSGTLLRAGSQLRLAVQLVEAPGGAVIWSHTLQVAFDDIFQLHDTLVNEIVSALSLQLTAREHRLLHRDVPANPRAYELYLRANELATGPESWPAALDLYQQCVALDPQYAPAWARMGRIYRMLSKYRDEGQETHRLLAVQALERALAVNPELSLAHNIVAQMEVDSGQGIQAMVRLLQQAAVAADPEIFAGLCYTCRYCGLLEASAAAHDHARRLDPKVATSVIHTYYRQRDFERTIACGDKGAPYVEGMALFDLGRTEEAAAFLRESALHAPPRMRDFMDIAVATVEGRNPFTPEVLAGLERGFFARVSDPEGLYYASRHLARCGVIDIALRELTRAVDGGYCCYPGFTIDSWLDNLRGRESFEAIMARAKARHAEAVQAFKAAGGERIIGVRAG
jgi:serine/threonine protein kinase